MMNMLFLVIKKRLYFTSITIFTKINSINYKILISLVKILKIQIQLLVNLS